MHSSLLLLCVVALIVAFADPIEAPGQTWGRGQWLRSALSAGGQTSSAKLEVFVITPAKVGSSSFLRSLDGDQYVVGHSHSLLKLRELLARTTTGPSGTSSSFLVVTGMRNPLQQALSYYVQQHMVTERSGMKCRVNEYLGDEVFTRPVTDFLSAPTAELLAEFWSSDWHGTFEAWWDEFWEITGLLDMGVEFDRERGMTLYQLSIGGPYLLLYTFERLVGLEGELCDLFGVEQWLHTNNKADPESWHSLYRERHAELRSAIVYPQKYKQRKLDNPTVRYFYGEQQAAQWRTLVPGSGAHWVEEGLRNWQATRPDEVIEWRSLFTGVSLVLCFSSGHVGTKSLSIAFDSAETASFDEVYVPDMPTALPLLKRAFHTQNATLLWEYLFRSKLPEILRRARGRKRIFMFGHDSIFGELAALLLLFPSNTRVVRLRRDPCDLTKSFAYNPPICPSFDVLDTRGYGVQFCPADAAALWKSDELRAMWNREPWYSGQSQPLVRVWWYLDEVEMQWRSLRKTFQYRHLEVYWDNKAHSFGKAVSRVAAFAGVAIPTAVPHRNRHAPPDGSMPAGVTTAGDVKSEDIRALRADYIAAMPDSVAAFLATSSSALSQCSWFDAKSIWAIM